MAARWPEAARRYSEASEILGYDLARVCAEGPDEKLADTRIAQPALYVTEFAIQEALVGEGVRPKFVAGHSLGEYTACACAGVFSFAEGLKAVKARAEAMSEAAAGNAGGMMAVMGAKPEDLQARLVAAKEKGTVVIANHNSPAQVVLSGTLPALDEVEKGLKQAGARVIRLKVSGAFHSPLMQEAADRMRKVLASMDLKDPKIPVIGNVTGLALGTVRLVRDELQSQLISGVRWDACVRAFAGNGVAIAVECGPGKVLSGLIRANDRSIRCLSAGSVSEIEGALAEIGGVASGTA